jgi:hypothetical protein
MRRVSPPDQGYIDYCYDHAARERWGIRVRASRAAIALSSDGNDLNRMVAVDNSQLPIPVP